MSSSNGKGQAGSTAAKAFDEGAADAMPNVDFSDDSISEAGSNATTDGGSSAKTTQPASLDGEPIDERDTDTGGTAGKGQEALGGTPGETVDEAKTQDTAGVGAMVL
ncbi:Uu.00g105880.m01.CDS01 [Anthostomella pinea]|uniref:Uu.00g105880.m01.CDS01 n=1 Tax=Anthostomella pinea TaxID=933095 RepID=A0AAI8YFU9_9PEZI|nr:Uu.00g105880.m01.CDS01 [Anthostomella pinea]